MRWDWVWPSEGGQDHRLGILILSGWKSDLCEQASTSPEYQTPDWGLGRAPCGKTHSHWGQGGTWSRLMLSGSWGSTFSKVMNSLERCFKTDRGFYRESLQKAWDGWPVNCLLTPRLSGSMQGSSDCMSPRCLGTGANQMALGVPAWGWLLLHVLKRSCHPVSPQEWKAGEDAYWEAMDEKWEYVASCPLCKPQHCRKFNYWHKDALSRALPVRKEADSKLSLENSFNIARRDSSIRSGLGRKWELSGSLHQQAQKPWPPFY